jgi:hypothetical protein
MHVIPYQYIISKTIFFHIKNMQNNRKRLSTGRLDTDFTTTGIEDEHIQAFEDRWAP